MSAGPVRVLALWSPDWPVTAAARAATVPAHRPAAVVAANRVLACSASARAHGVRRDLRLRDAQARCPELVVLARDPDRDARAFEPVVVAIEELAPGVEVVRPGLVVLAAQGPGGYFGGERAAAERLVGQVAARTGVECQVGLADGLFAAVLAARRGVTVEPGHTPGFLAPLRVEELDREPEVDRSELIGLLHRLGLRSLGAFGALDAQDVASRFGADAVLAHRLARGLDPRPPARRRPPEELAVEVELDPPVDRVDAAAFAARGLAERLHRSLAGHGLSCTRLGVTAYTVAGEELRRIWRCAEPLTPAGTVDRVRWQLNAWLTQPPRRRSSAAFAGAAVSDAVVSDGELAGSLAVSDGELAGSLTRGGGFGAVSRLRLVPEETVTAGALQLGLWGEVGEADERAGRALVRVQALLGPESVVTGVLVGGREPTEQVRLVCWGDDRETGDVGAGPGMIGVGEPGAASSAAEGAERLITAFRRPLEGVSPVGVLPEVVPPRDEQLGGERLGGERADTPARGGAPAGWPPDAVRSTGRTSPAPGEPRPVKISTLEPGAAGSAATGTESSIIAAVEPGAGVPGEQAGSGERADSGERGGSEERSPIGRRRPTAARRSTSTRGRPAVREPPRSWPGRLPAPSPATVPAEPLPAELFDATGQPVLLAAPDLLTAPPHRVAVDGDHAHEVQGWTGPWPIRQRWWTPDGVDGSRLQVACDNGVALLLLNRNGRWWVTGVYD